jgi:hypothetical protein
MKMPKEHLRNWIGTMPALQTLHIFTEALKVKTVNSSQVFSLKHHGIITIESSLSGANLHAILNSY